MINILYLFVVLYFNIDDTLSDIGSHYSPRTMYYDDYIAYWSDFVELLRTYTLLTCTIDVVLTQCYYILPVVDAVLESTSLFYGLLTVLTIHDRAPLHIHPYPSIPTLVASSSQSFHFLP